MKKQLIACFAATLIAAPAAPVLAQYNEVFQYTVSPYGNVVSTPADLIASDGLSTTSLGIVTDPVATIGYYNAGIILKKVNASGGVIFDKLYYPTDSNTVIYPNKLIQTADSGYIAVGLYDNMLGTSCAFALRFDKLGNYQWFKYYPNLYGDNGNWNIERAGITRAKDDTSGERYIIVAGAAADPGGLYPQDNYLDALKIDVNGNLIWHNQYQPTWGRSGYNELNDNPTTISYISRNSTHGSSYFIAGHTAWWQLGPTYYTFYLGIDNNGNITHNYTTFSTPQYPIFTSSLYDSTGSQAICLAYTFGNTTIASPYSASAIGFTKINMSYNPISTMFYYIPAMYATENYGTSIAKTHDQDNGYIIGTWNGFNPPFPGNYSGGQAGILKLSNSGNVDFFDFYNTLAYWHVPGTGVPIADIYDAATHQENFAISAGSLSPLSTTSSLRIVRTFVTGIQCGEANQTIALSQYNTPTASYGYTPVRERGVDSIQLQVPAFRSSSTPCNTAMPQYRIAGIDNNVMVYPTLLNSASNMIHIQLGVAANTTMTVQAFGIDGRMTGSQTFNLSQGENTLSWDAPLPQAGNYILVLTTADKTVHKTIRISKL